MNPYAKIKKHVLHGTPITPVSELMKLEGHSFCVSFAAPQQLDRCIDLQDPTGMLMLDNGAWSKYRSGGGAVDRASFFEWANDAQDRCEVAVAVIPDIINGDEASNWMEAAWAVRNYSAYTERLMYVWHMNESLDLLKNACRLFNFVAIGSVGDTDVMKQRKAYLARLREASHMIDYVERFYERRPWIHLMRGIDAIRSAIRFESADSATVAFNHWRGKEAAVDMAERLRTSVQNVADAAPVGKAYSTSNFDNAVTTRTEWAA